MVTIKQFAAKQGLTYEAVRKQVSKYQKELSGHIFTENKTLQLDSYAEEFLAKKRKVKTIVIQAEPEPQACDKLQAPDSRIQELQAELISAEKIVIELQSQLAAVKDAYYKERSELLEEKNNYLALIAEHNESQTKQETIISGLTSENEALSQNIELLQEELKSYQKTVFGLYRRNKKQ